jgi:hypothetical protein
MNWSVDRAVIHRRERLRREKDEDTFTDQDAFLELEHGAAIFNRV